MIEDDIDEFWCYLFAMRIGSNLPKDRVKNKFIAFVKQEVIRYNLILNEEELLKLFIKFLENLSEGLFPCR
tara:strand:+ start:4438 stop:4650 length:213 start_codon:yes stop_codon:yes gene_type:complete